MQPVLDPVVPDYVHKLQRIDTYDEIEEIMKSFDFEMAGAPERKIFLEDTLLLAEGTRHTELKQLFAPLMSRQAIAYYELHLVEPVVKSFIDDLLDRYSKDGIARLDIVPLLHAALTRISALVTGVDGVDTPETTERFCSLVLLLSSATTASYSSPEPEVLIEKGKAGMMALVDEFLRPSLNRRIALAKQVEEGEISREDLPRDMLMSLCLAQDLSRPDDDGRIAYIWRQCALFLTASVKTTSHAMPHMLVHIDEWIKEHPEDQALLTDTEFLHRAAAESLRLHQSTPARFRAAKKDVILTTGRRVAAGEMVALHAPIANTSEAAFGADARYFNPRRHVPEGVQPWGMTFGLGAHSCMGRNLVTGIQNKGDSKFGAHGTAVRILLALYSIGVTLDEENPPRRPKHSLHDYYESVHVVLKNA